MLTYFRYSVVEKKWDVKDTFILRLKPIAQPIPQFKPGQYVVIKNPTYRNKNEEHIFSLASSPNNTSEVEFCIKIFGPWTKYLSKAVKEDSLLISNPSGTFVWDESITNAVFLIGGVGISPIISMLRYIVDSKIKPNLTLIYGIPSPDVIPYKQILEQMKKKLSLKIVNMYSESTTQTEKSYNGFITEEIISKEVDLKKNPIFFYCGPNAFIAHIKNILTSLKIPQENIRSELRE